jgi:hypothetical protein
MQFKLQNPVIITPRLMVGVQIDGVFVSIEYAGDRNGRQAYRYHIDLPDGTEHSADDLASGVGGGSLQSGLESLLSFLIACGESWSYQQRTGREGENADLFPAAVAEWAAQNQDELPMLAIELEENPGLIEEC